mmetsp:Transcript_59138/g.139201  ORF Transcript_59138/g.139201 Transcript_59138/m.139201 type:complete len:226 (+) Transcript_59138:2132-2809(+)
MLALMRNSRLPNGICSSDRASRNCSASTAASAAPVCGSSTPNSSPPMRATESSLRKLRASRLPTARSTASPAAWPCVSLTFLKWSKSSAMTACPSPQRSRRSRSSTLASCQARRFIKPVSASVLASRCSSAWASCSSRCLRRSSSSAMAWWASCSSQSSWRSVRRRAIVSRTASVPIGRPQEAHSGTPLYMTKPLSTVSARCWVRASWRRSTICRPCGLSMTREQ